MVDGVKLKALPGHQSAGTVGGKARAIKILEDWMKSYGPRSFDDKAPGAEVLAAGKGAAMGMNRMPTAGSC